MLYPPPPCAIACLSCGGSSRSGDTPPDDHSLQKKQKGLIKIFRIEDYRYIGIPLQLKGARQLEFAVRLACIDEDNLHYIVDNIYDTVAIAFTTSRSAVEKNIRTIVDKIKANCSFYDMSQLAGYDYDIEDLTNARLIEMLASDYKRRLRKQPPKNGG